MSETRKPKNPVARVPDSSSAISSRNDARTATLFSAVLIVALACVMFSSALFSRRVLIPGDLLQFIYPWKTYTSANTPVRNPAVSDAVEYFYPARVYLYRRLSQGQVPLWNPHQNAGQPFAATGQSMVFYPLNALLVLAAGPQDSFELFAFLHCAMAGFFIFLMLRGLKCRTHAALFGGVSYMFCGWLTAWTLFPPFQAAAAWAPLVLHFFGQSLRKNSWKNALCCGVAYGNLLLTGHMQIAAYVLLAAIVLTCVYISPWPRRDKAPRISAMFLLSGGALAAGLLIGAIQVLPTMDLLRESARTASRFSAMTVRPMQLITFFMPDFFGNPAEGRCLLRPEQYVYGMGYFGIGGLLLALSAPLLRRDRETVGWAIVAALGILGAAGVCFIMPLLSLPGLRMFQANRMLFLADLGGVALAALAWETLSDRGRKSPSVNTPGISRTVLPAAVIAAIVLFLLYRAGVRELMLDPRKTAVFEHPEFLRLLFFAACVVLAISLRGLHRGAASGLMIAAAAVDLMTWGFKFNPAEPPESVYPTTPSIQYLLDKREPYRFQGLQGNLFPNSAMVYGLQDVHGYEPYALARYENLVRAVVERDKGKDPGYSAVIMTNIHDVPFYNLANVRYVMSAAPLSGPANEFAFSDDVDIYRNRNALPRAVFFGKWRVDAPEHIRRAVARPDFQEKRYLLLERRPEFRMAAGNQRGEVNVEQYDPEYVRLHSESRAAGFVFISDAFSRGWEAVVDGKQTPIFAADYAFRAVPVGSGTHDVVFRYRPLSVYAGIVISLLSLAACALALLCACRENRRELSRTD